MILLSMTWVWIAVISLLILGALAGILDWYIAGIF